MAAEPSPAFLFYVKDWLGDAKVRAMSNEARGVYIDLLCYCWQDGALPADPVQITADNSAHHRNSFGGSGRNSNRVLIWPETN